MPSFSLEEEEEEEVEELPPAVDAAAAAREYSLYSCFFVLFCSERGRKEKGKKRKNIVSFLWLKNSRSLSLFLVQQTKTTCHRPTTP